MKQHVKKLLARPRDFFLASVFQQQQETLQKLQQVSSQVAKPYCGTSQESQILLAMKYRDLLLNNGPLPKFDDVEFRAYSQNGEDGILLYLFSLLGTTNKRSVEICAGNGLECNTANLIINHGWTGLLCDGNEAMIENGREFYRACQDTFIWPPTLVNAWITAENVNSLISSQGFHGEIDLLSLDIDGVDYWIWQAITCIKPRVVVLEYQAIWGPDKSVSVPYQPDFTAGFSDDGRFAIYAGASLSAFVKLGREKGYRLVGCQRYGFNAFFVRNDVGQNIFPEISPSECFTHPFTKWAVDNLLPMMADRAWVEI